MPQHYPTFPQNPTIPHNSQLPDTTPNSPLPPSPQVTSSTDRKETTAPPIEEFMDNLTSISTENFIDNIHSISQEQLVCSPAHLAYSPAPPLRSVSQNSSRYNALINTSNMVVNDMSSVLTQLAEENKFLNMRP